MSTLSLLFSKLKGLRHCSIPLFCPNAHLFIVNQCWILCAILSLTGPVCGHLPEALHGQPLLVTIVNAFVSSAILVAALLTPSSRSLMNKWSSAASNIDPCGTPLPASLQCENCPSLLTPYYFLFNQFLICKITHLLILWLLNLGQNVPVQGWGAFSLSEESCQLDFAAFSVFLILKHLSYYFVFHIWIIAVVSVILLTCWCWLW